MPRTSPNPAGVERVARHLREGGIAAFPTETVYGLGAVVWDDGAIAQVFARKGRPLFDPVIAHVADRVGLEQVWDRARTPPEVAALTERLCDACWPGPLTVLVPRRAEVPDLATAGLPVVGVRMPSHDVARALLRAVGQPVVAPSANRFGRISPTTADAVLAELGEDLLTLDGGPCSVGVESTVVAFDPDGSLRVLRPGGVPMDRLRELVGREVQVGPRGRIEAPGQLDSHYAPAALTRLLQHQFPDAGVPRGRWAVLSSTTSEAQLRTLAGPQTEIVTVEVLSAAGDSIEAARRLFAALRRLDGAGAPILIEPWTPDGGLSDALRDRLRRAAARR